MQRMRQESSYWRILNYVLLSRFSLCREEGSSSRGQLIHVVEMKAIASLFVLSSLNFTLKIILLKISQLLDVCPYSITCGDLYESLPRHVILSAAPFLSASQAPTG